MQFILGGAGAGKTHTFCRTIIESSIQNPKVQHLVIVPEQFTLSTQLDFVRMHPDHGIMNIDVLSFERLAYRIFEETGSDTVSVLRDTGKSLLLRRAAEELGEELKVFGRNFRKPGYVSEMKSLLSEFEQYRIGPEKLEELQALCSSRDLLAQKLSDIRLLQERFFALLGREYITGEQLLERLARLLPQASLTKGAVIGFDGFTGFTPIQLTVAAELLKQARQIYVTLNMDPEADGLQHGEASLFFLQQTCMQDLLALAKETGTEAADPIRLNRPYPRYRKAPELAFLEEHLFRETGSAAYQGKPEQIRLHAARNPQEECRFAASEIVRLVRSGYRYRDIAVIASDMDAYGSYLETELEARKIPAFLDGRRDILQNAFVEYMRSAIGLVEEQFSYASVVRYLKCGISEWPDEDTFLLENYLLALGISRHKQWEEAWTRKPKWLSEENLARLNRMRKRLVAEVADFTAVFGTAGGKQMTVEAATRALYELIVSQEMQLRIDQRAKAYAASGNLILAKEYEQIYRVVLDLFDQFVLLLGSETVRAGEYRELLEAGLTEARVGIVPPGRDQVVVGDPKRTRLSEVRAVFFVGFNDGYIPAKKKTGGILTDSERRFLGEEQVTLAPDAVKRIAIQRFYLYFSFAKPTERLYLTFSNVNMDGAPMQPACYLRDLAALFPDLRPEDEVAREQTRDLAASEPAALRYLAFGLTKDPTGDPVWMELYRRFCNRSDTKALVKKLISARFGEGIEKLEKGEPQKLYGTLMEVSASRLETYAACPYSFFLQYGLRLTEREIYQFRLADEGTVLHDALCHYGRYLRKLGYTWADVPEEEREAISRKVLHDAAADYDHSVLTSTARLSYTRERLFRLLSRTVWALGRQMEAGSFEAEEYELTFGDTQRNGIVLPAGEDGSMRLIGKIDRLDLARTDDMVCLKVLDYKTGDRKMDIGAVYHGIDLQLLLYLQLAGAYVGEHDPGRRIVPGGVFFYQVKDPLLPRAGLSEDPEQAILKELKPSGLINDAEAILPLFDKDFSSEGPVSSIVVPAAVRKDGGLTKSTTALSTEEFTKLTEHLKKKVQTYGGEIMDGRIEASPYRLGTRTPCKYCTYRMICGFSPEKEGCRERRLPALDLQAVRERLHEES